MEQKFDDFSIQQAMRMAKSPAGQQLLSLLQSSDGESLRRAMEQAASGDYAAAQKSLSCLLSSDQARELLRQMRG